MALLQFSSGIIRLTTAKELYGTVDAPAPCASTDVQRGDAQSVATKNKQPRSIFVLVPVLLSLDTFPYVRAANLVLLKLYSLGPHTQKDQFITDVCTTFVIDFPFQPT